MTCDLKSQVTIPGECCLQCKKEFQGNKTVENQGYDIKEDDKINVTKSEEHMKTCIFKDKVYQVSELKFF